MNKGSRKTKSLLARKLNWLRDYLGISYCVNIA
jgi:hypothetical protein